LEELQRLPRELHDSVSQALYAIGLNTSAGATPHGGYSNPYVARLRGDVLGFAETGLAEMRALIFELRQESLETEGFVGVLEKQAATAHARHRLHVDISRLTVRPAEARCFACLSASRRLAHHLYLGVQVEERAHSLADNEMIIGDHKSDHWLIQVTAV
jgi:signal transduction histidine kinase